MDPKRLSLQETLTSTCSSHDSAPGPEDDASLLTGELFSILQRLEYSASVAPIANQALKGVSMSQGQFPQSHGFVPSTSSPDLHAFYEGRTQVPLLRSDLLSTCVQSRRFV
jgi:hypothetical protein